MKWSINTWHIFTCALMMLFVIWDFSIGQHNNLLLHNNEPLSEHTLTYCQLDPKEEVTNQNTIIFCEWNEFENATIKMSSTLCSNQCVNLDTSWLARANYIMILWTESQDLEVAIPYNTISYLVLEVEISIMQITHMTPRCHVPRWWLTALFAQEGCTNIAGKWLHRNPEGV